MAYDSEWRFSGSRRVPRPERVEICEQCGKRVGMSYPDCPLCFDAIERFWLADWAALLEIEQVDAGMPDETLLAQVVIEESERHPWTVVDMAMSLLRCGTCGNELGSRYNECGECGMAFGSSLVSEYGATMNEHALHIGRWVLRHKQQHGENSIIGWQRTMPRVLTGWLPTTPEAQQMGKRIKDGELDVVDEWLAEVDRQINAKADLN
ncbi:MAG: hypothetical protein H7175_15390 [Burkholderiales bacterium]|nr:hypothetical protein [Anaerolineae bacterium]